MISAKGKRKIEVDGKTYVWNVAEDYDSPYKVIQIVSADKKMILAVPLQVPRPYAISKGSVFQGHPTGGGWERYALPFVIPNAITPGFVAELIRWSVYGNDAEAVAWDGNDYPV